MFVGMIQSQWVGQVCRVVDILTEVLRNRYVRAREVNGKWESATSPAMVLLWIVHRSLTGKVYAVEFLFYLSMN